MTVRRGLAANPAVPLADLAPLLHGGDLPTLIALARRADLTPALAAALVEPAAEESARNPATVPYLWRLLVTHPDPHVRRYLADNPALPPEAQETLVLDPDALIRRTLAWRRDLRPDLVPPLAADLDVTVRREIAWHAQRPATLLQDPDSRVRGNALHGGPPPTDLLAGLLADPRTRADAAAHADDPDQVAALVADHDPAVREAVAGSEKVPFALVRALARDPDEDVRAAVMLRPDTPDDVRDALVAGVEPQSYHVAGWLMPGRAPLAARLAQVGSRYVFCRRAVAFSRDLPAEAVARLATDDDFSVRLLLAENSPDVPGNILPDLVRAAGHARWDLVRHPSMPAPTLTEFAASADDDLRRLAATAPNLAPADAAALAVHPDRTTRRYVAANPALPGPILLTLLDDPDPEIAEAAAGNPTLPLPVARQLLAG